MAHRLIAQIVLTGSRVLGRAFIEAYRQAAASSRHAQAVGTSGSAATGTAKNNIASAGLTLDEACKILNVAPPQAGKANMEVVTERFKRLFDLNDPQKGGSFYLQSKVLRARERIEMEVREAERTAQQEEKLKGEWHPKIYKDR
ncbi:MAG: mitochondrial import inner membrane translocase subunit TIM16 [Watsoniomyces obsoletus]|nr:MAG: mitochondrial import inner membrane translocase subunit TIM16 [Watsoniomyces obsoletus]